MAREYIDIAVTFKFISDLPSAPVTCRIMKNSIEAYKTFPVIRTYTSSYLLLNVPIFFPDDENRVKLDLIIEQDAVVTKIVNEYEDYIVLISCKSKEE